MGGEERALRTAGRAARLAIAAAVASAAAAGIAATERSDQCEALEALQIPRVRILAAVAVEAGSHRSADGETYAIPAACRVSGEARPKGESRIGFEVWMPAQGWNGRYYQIGTGGFGGRIHYPSLAAEVRNGNAVASTDTGHRGTQFDASWARAQPQKIIDYGYRSIGATSDAARRIVAAYYGTQARKRYFVGCSNGGRQALMAAERFPDDWEGILAGAPATPWTRHFASFASIQHALRKDAASWLPAAKLPAIQRAAVRSCTAEARVVAGVPGDPRFCRLEPAELMCRDAETDECVTPAQAATLAEIVRSGYEPTAAAYPDNWAHWIVNDDARAKTQLTLSEEFFRYMVFEDPSWTVARFDASRDPARAEAKRVDGEPLSRVLDPGTDLLRLSQRGAKLIMYAGWGDALLSPYAAIDYYQRVAQRMGDLERTRGFFRLFMIPGMTHCQGGPAPHAFGQAASVPALHDDARHSIRVALEDWVERGVVPERIVAAKYVNDDARHGVAATRTICAFPQAADCRTNEGG